MYIYLYLSPFSSLVACAACGTHSDGQWVECTAMGSGWNVLPIWSGYTFSVLALCRSQLLTGFAQIVFKSSFFLFFWQYQIPVELATNIQPPAMIRHLQLENGSSYVFGSCTKINDSS